MNNDLWNKTNNDLWNKTWGVFCFDFTIKEEYRRDIQMGMANDKFVSCHLSGPMFKEMGWAKAFHNKLLKRLDVNCSTNWISSRVCLGDENWRNVFAGTFPLYTAAFAGGKGGYEWLKFLLENGADVNQQVDECNKVMINAGESALHIANDKEIVNLLIDLGADVNLKDKKGFTPLYYACMKRNPGKVKILLENGADLGIKYNIKGTEYSLQELMEKELLGNPDDHEEIEECLSAIAPNKETEKENAEILRSYEEDWSELEEIYDIGLHAHLKETRAQLPKKGTYVEKDECGIITLMATVRDHKLVGPYERYDIDGELIEKGNYDENEVLDGKVVQYSFAKLGATGSSWTGPYETTKWDDRKRTKYESFRISLKHGLPDGECIWRDAEITGSYERVWAGSDSIGSSVTEIEVKEHCIYRKGKIYTDFLPLRDGRHVVNGKIVSEWDQTTDKQYQADLKRIKKRRVEIPKDKKRQGLVALLDSLNKQPPTAIRKAAKVATVKECRKQNPKLPTR